MRKIYICLFCILSFVVALYLYKQGPVQAAKNCRCREWTYEDAGGGTECTEDGVVGGGRCRGKKKVCADSVCDDDGGGGGGGGGGGTTPTTAPTSAATCTTQSFTSGTVSPNSVRPGDQVTVKCDFDKRLDCLSVSGGGLTNCRYSRYEDGKNILQCDAGKNAGYYDDVKCVLRTSTTDNCCAASHKAGNINIIGTDVHYDQDIVLPFGTYTLSVKAHSVFSRNKGVRVSLICNAATCANSTTQNAEISSLAFPETADFTTRTKTITLSGTGDDRHYLIQIAVDKGSEAYFESISLKGANGREMVQNGNFAQTANGTISTEQPTGWGEGDNRVGYYYGSLMSQTTTPPTQPTPTTAAPTGGPTPTTGPASTVSLALKIKLQGIPKKPKKADPITVQVKLGGGALTAATAYKTAQFSVDDSGIWSGTVSFDNIHTGGGYRIYVKGPKHIQKKICVAAPTETTMGTYHCAEGQVVLKAGENAFDFSKIVQMAGDLPQTDGKQNGIIDAYDTTYIRQNLGTTDTTKTAIGDLNFDTIIDSQDYSTVLQSLSIKFDEE